MYEINVIDSHGETAQSKAAARGHVDVIRYLIEFGALLTITDSDGSDALMIAAQNGKLDVVRYFTEYRVCE
ncbi:hypothetical protein PHMEG_00018712 [Phytophthora megakarya]|uniref:Uncharacterized protein n=1 Tax=Phytophthora megakarya TaxID=4795 RepID=A0A225VTE3_9STRA|nr:hypothetical protein PHMEG_00018712 [Phytophthora megakarya]